MKSLTVGLFNDQSIGSDLGKKGTESDMVFYNRKEGDTIYTFMQPLEEKASAKAQIMSAIDAAVVSFETLNPELGETILMLDAMGIGKGVAIAAPGTDVKAIVEMTRGTALESFTVRDRDQHHILDTLSKFGHVSDSAPVSVAVDHSFSVKGVGEVVLGFVRSGTVKKHQKLQMHPGGKEVLVRSIQMHDKDFDEAPSGSRVGLAIKGATAEEMRRGVVLAEPGSYLVADRFELEFASNRFYKGGIVPGKFNMVVGMQSFPVDVVSAENGHVSVTADRKVAYRKDDTFIMLDLNAQKVRFIGAGRPS